MAKLIMINDVILATCQVYRDMIGDVKPLLEEAVSANN